MRVLWRNSRLRWPHSTLRQRPLAPSAGGTRFSSKSRRSRERTVQLEGCNEGSKCDRRCRASILSCMHHAQETNLVRACGGSLFCTSCPRSPVLYINDWYILCLPLSFLLPFQVAPSTGLYRSSQSIRLPSALRRRNSQPNPWCLYDRRFSSQHSLSRLHPFAGHLSSSANSVSSALPTPPGATLGGRIDRNTKLYHLCALTFLCC